MHRRRSTWAFIAWTTLAGTFIRHSIPRNRGSVSRRRVRWGFAIVAVGVEVGAFVAWRLVFRRDRPSEIRRSSTGE